MVWYPCQSSEKHRVWGDGPGMGETLLSTGLALRRARVLQGVNPASMARARLGEVTVTGRVSL